MRRFYSSLDQVQAITLQRLDNAAAGKRAVPTYNAAQVLAGSRNKLLAQIASRVLKNNALQESQKAQSVNIAPHPAASARVVKADDYTDENTAPTTTLVVSALSAGAKRKPGSHAPCSQSAPTAGDQTRAVAPEAAASRRVSENVAPSALNVTQSALASRRDEELRSVLNKTSARSSRSLNPN